MSNYDEKQFFEIIKKYNEYRSPEATAKLIKHEINHILVEFTGPFCRTCGFYYYFDDLKFELEDSLKIPVKVASIKEVENEKFLVKFSLKKLNA